MKIGINIDQLLYRISGGTGRYSHNLISSLARIDEENEYVLFHSRAKKEDLNRLQSLNLSSNFSTKDLPFPRPFLSALWNRSRFCSIEFFLGRLDLIHAPTFAIPAKGSAKLIVTVHDLAFMKFPQFYTRRSLKFHQRSARIAACEADLLLAVSHSTKWDIMSLLSVEEERVRVVYEGVEIDNSLLDSVKRRKVLSDHGINKRYILFVGTLEPRKNVVRLLQAFNKLKQKTRFEHLLVLVGPEGWLYQEILRESEKEELKGSVILTNSVSDAELAVLMSEADLFVYPSLYEGFGLPPLEAMACGTPVISSNVSSLPEIVGEAGILVDPNSIDDIAAAMINVLEDSSLRDKLVQKGKQRAKLFSWEQTARETLEAYLSVLEGTNAHVHSSTDERGA